MQVTGFLAGQIGGYRHSLENDFFFKSQYLYFSIKFYVIMNVYCSSVNLVLAENVGGQVGGQ